MNYNVRLKCLTCNTLIDCRIGRSNRDIQNLRFACPTCAEVIEIEIEKSTLKFKGAENIIYEGSFTGEFPFIDLHLDFPVAFGEYKMGLTTFLMAIHRIGHENYFFHNSRLDALNTLYPKLPEFKRVIRLYSRNKKLFSQLSKKYFAIDTKSQKQEDINATLYLVIAKFFYPFSFVEDIAETSDYFSHFTMELAKSEKQQFNMFIEEIIETNFLKNIQADCLEIYPRIFDAEVPLRPALFLDFDGNYEGKEVAFRVSSHEFETYKDLYKDISEILSRQLILVAGLNNIFHRSDFNKFNKTDKRVPKNLHEYADIPYGLKTQYIDSGWYEVDTSSLDNQLRNSIAHYKIEYDEVSQIITYYPKREGIRQERKESIYFLDFMRKLLFVYREMHKLHHLIKCLYYYYYLIYLKK